MDLLLLAGNILCFIGTVLNAKDVIKNRNILKGYSLSGSALTFSAVLLFNICFWNWKEYLSVAFGLVTLAYWLLVTLYLIRERLK